MVDAVHDAPAALGPIDLAEAFAFATDWLAVHEKEVNALNVYPVPDGDTGTNMHLTLQSVRRQLAEEKPQTMAAFAHALSYGSLLGARGNSGVILSQVLKGFAESARKHRSLGVEELRAALKNATKTAYAAVMKPVEGTILTVVRATSEAAAASLEVDPLTVLRDAHRGGEDALERTPELLPLLKQAGVVDAGGLGYLRMLEGIIAHFEGRGLPQAPKVQRQAQTDFEESTFGFCTEFLMADTDASTDEIRRLVEPYGDSLLVVGAEGFVKGHVHTEEPERLLAEVARHGRMVRTKVEDMSEQHHEILSGVDPTETREPNVGLVAVTAGYGVTKAFRSLGARVVGGGQTNNPSVEDIADTVRTLGARHVIVMPNNKNIVMAAERVDELVKDKTVHVLGTTSIGAGLAAAVAFDPEGDVEAVLESMRQGAEHGRTLTVTTANRDATIDDVAVEAGDFIGLADGTLLVSAATPEEALLELLDEAEEADVATLFYNASIDEAALERTVAAIRERHPEIELEVQAGAPDLYPYLVALE